MREKWIIVIIGGMLGLSLLFYGINKRSSIMPGDWTQIMILLGLVVVTGAYAWAASRQADASVKMANEMREQRYAAVRPVIDIEWWPAAGEEGYVRVAGVLAIEKGKPPQSQLPDKLTCILRNIGLGTATDVYSFVQAGTQPDDECHRPRALGTLAKNEATDKWPLFLKQKDDRKFLVAYYRDVYGRYFESSREVSGVRIDQGGYSYQTTPSETRKLAEEEFPK